MLTEPKVSLLRLQPTTGCNLNCSYCYIPAEVRKRTMRMSYDVLETTLRRLVEEDLLEHELTISWHGAEPLMAGLAWYRDSFDLVAKHLVDHRVVHLFQTNGVLIDNAWCDFFVEHSAHVGVSLDGAGALAAPRVNWAGRPAERDVRRGIDRLNERRLAWTLLAVVTAETMAEPDAFVDSFALPDVVTLDSRSRSPMSLTRVGL